MPERGFLIFLNFFAIYFGIFLPGLDRNIAGMMFFFFFFLIFAIFLLFFLEFSSPGRVGTEFGTKIFSPFLGLSHPVLDRNIARKRFFNFFNFFWKFLA